MDKKISHTQENELTHSMVHYLLTIHKLRETKGYARVTDIAKDLNLTKGSVSTAITNLRKRELVVEDDSKFLSLSETGHKEVHKILTARTLLYYFFTDMLSVEDDTAHKDSCLMEHLLSNETREKLFEYMKSHYKGELDISSYSSFEDFQRHQKGDSYL